MNIIRTKVTFGDSFHDHYVKPRKVYVFKGKSKSHKLIEGIIMVNTYNLFISHSWSYGDAYDRLVDILDNATYFSYKNYSIPRDDPIHNAPNSQALYDAIKGQMSSCQVVLILAGVYATYSNWINKEIKISKSEFYNKKPILAIEPWGSEKTSQVVKDNADLIVGWNTDSIINGIRELV